MRPPVIFHEIEVFRAGRIQGGVDGGDGDIADRGVGESFVFVGVEGAAVGLDPLMGDAGVGVAAVIEGAVHLEAHTTFDAIVDHGSDLGHLLTVGGFFLDDRGDGEDLLPGFGLPGAEGLLGEGLVAVQAEAGQHPYHPFFMQMEGDMIRVGEDARFGKGAEPAVELFQLRGVHVQLLRQLFEEDDRGLSGNERHRGEMASAGDEPAEKFQAIDPFFTEINPSPECCPQR